MQRQLTIIGVLFALSGCGDLSQTQGTLFSAELPGLGDFDNTTKEERADAAWWDKFYGRADSSGTTSTGGGQIGGNILGQNEGDKGTNSFWGSGGSGSDNTSSAPSTNASGTAASAPQ